MTSVNAVVQSKPLAWLRAASLSYMLGYAFFAMIVGWIVELLLSGLSHPLARLHLALPLLLLACKGGVHAPEVAACLAAAFTRRQHGAAPALARPSPFTLAFCIDKTLRRGFVAWLCRRRPTARPAGQAFSYLEQGSYSTFAALLMVVCLVELPVDAMIVTLLVHDPGARTIIHLVCGLVGAYSIACVLGDRWMIDGGYHVLTDTCFDMRIGERSICLVPLGAIDDCEVLGETRSQWCARRGVDVRSTMLVTPADRPNVVLRLKPGATIAALKWGHEIGGAVSAVFLYLDRPGALAGAIASKTGSPGSETR